MIARFLALLVLVPLPASAATLYFAPARIQAEAGVPFTVALRADVLDGSVHAAEADIRYDQRILSVEGISHANSLLTNFSTEPSASGGAIRFSGWMERPYTGAGGELISVTFVPARTGTTSLDIQSGTLLAADVQENNVVTGLASAAVLVAAHHVPAPIEKVPGPPISAASSTVASSTTPAQEPAVPIDTTLASSAPNLIQTAAAGSGASNSIVPVDYLVLAALALVCVGIGFCIAYLFFRAGRPG